jgi:hypothetical protein
MLSSDKIFKLLSFGKQAKTEPKKFSRIVLINAISIISLFFLLIYAVLETINGEYILAAILYFVSILGIFNIIRLNRTRKIAFSEYFIIIIASVLFIYLIVIGGPWKLGYLWSLLIPALSLILLSLRRGTIFSAIYIALVIIIIAPGFSFMKTDYTPGFILRFLTGNLSACLFL